MAEPALPDPDHSARRMHQHIIDGDPERVPAQSAKRRRESEEVRVEEMVRQFSRLSPKGLRLFAEGLAKAADRDSMRTFTLMWGECAEDSSSS